MNVTYNDPIIIANTPNCPSFGAQIFPNKNWAIPYSCIAGKASINIKLIISKITKQENNAIINNDFSIIVSDVSLDMLNPSSIKKLRIKNIMKTLVIIFIF
jgi:hypothetical protein